MADKSGYFDNLTNEYVITDMFPVRELKNYLWNDDTICSCNQFLGGACHTVRDSVKTNIDEGERNVYIKDEKTGTAFCCNRNYQKSNFEVFECRVGLGYQRTVAVYNGVKALCTLLLPVKGRTVMLDVKIENVSGEDKDLSVYFYSRPTPNESNEDCYTEAVKAQSFNGVKYMHDAYSKPYYARYYVSSQKPVSSFAAAKGDFIGVYGNAFAPEGLNEKELPSRGVTFENDIIGALKISVKLKKGEVWENNYAIGVSANDEECEAEAKYFCLNSTYSDEFEKLKSLNAAGIETFRLSSSDPVLDAQTNVWLKRQLSLGKDWGRVYGKGFRDVMQDIASFTSLAPATARERIVDVLKWQYEDGNPIRMFDPCFYYPYNDCGSWIPATVLQYINESGDLTVLSEEVPYLKGTSKEKSGYDKPSEFKKHDPTAYTESVFLHVKKSVDYLTRCLGSHGLVLLLGGDWNDSLNAAGKKGRGESVWLTLATVKAVNEFIEILKLTGKTEEIAEYEKRKKALTQSVLKSGVDGKHLIYGYNDEGEPIGADACESAKIYLNPQTWAVLANLTDKPTLETFMDEAEKRLKCAFGYMQLTPCYTHGDDSLGRITYFKNGIVENGAVYNHGVAFKIVADCMLGRADKAYETLLKIRYDNPANPNNGMEPYAFSNFYIGPENEYTPGFAPMSWITGTAGWIYRAVTEFICGVKPTYRGLKIEPCISEKLTVKKVKRIFRGQKYVIEYERGENKGLIVNGERISGNVIPYDKSEKEIKVKVVY